MKIIYGSAQLIKNYGINKLKKKTDKKELSKIIKILNLNKSNIIDTAKAYGRSEEMLGKLINKKFKIITKIKSLRKYKKNQLEKLIFNQVLDSIEKLKIKNIYAVLIHDTKDLKSINSNIIYQVILNLKKIGISMYL